jgi:putative transcriptional regulator
MAAPDHNSGSYPSGIHSAFGYGTHSQAYRHVCTCLFSGGVLREDERCGAMSNRWSRSVRRELLAKENAPAPLRSECGTSQLEAVRGIYSSTVSPSEVIVYVNCPLSLDARSVSYLPQRKFRYSYTCNLYQSLCMIFLSYSKKYRTIMFMKAPARMNLRLARVEKNLSQQELADIVNVSRQTIGLIEKGGYNPTLKLCIRIAKALDKSLDLLFREDIENE